eukprot:CAMPEP_0118950268 /NCGR_PEP_ID=MMETSP1169-20130426/51088_1 /TAXON_ID=36882 /ORGANISM="Pyramimonas obovata, Strain CCMP722" /LENGTH=84 /DNA_ID=CAMNT_0006897069 /DNA_START=238 /DNA_END=489 /DNA_ORIENTATION=+
MSDGRNTILWFRNGLRLHDNPALLEACKDATHMHPVYIMDPGFLDPERVGVKRLKFLLNSLEDLDKSLRAHKSQLFVCQGKPQE